MESADFLPLPPSLKAPGVQFELENLHKSVLKQPGKWKGHPGTQEAWERDRGLSSARAAMQARCHTSSKDLQPVSQPRADLGIALSGWGSPLHREMRSVRQVGNIKKAEAFCSQLLLENSQCLAQLPASVLMQSCGCRDRAALPSQAVVGAGMRHPSDCGTWAL